MPILSSGTGASTAVVFNSGIFCINGLELATLQDVSISLNWSTKEIRQLGSLIMVTAPKRTSWKPSAKAKVKSATKELISFFMGSSGTDSSGYAYSVLDGQNVLSRCSIKFYVNDDSTKAAEFQFTNATLAGAFTLGLKLEDAAEADFEIQSQNVTFVTNYTTP